MSAALSIPPAARGTMELLQARGHTIAARMNKYGSIRYRIDEGRELQAIEMFRWYERHYEPKSKRART